jgi:hypothetical protein
MDKNELKEMLLGFLVQLEAEGYPIDFAGLPPSLPEYDRRLKLQIYSTKLLEIGVSESLRILVYRMADLLPNEVDDYIKRIQICRKPAEITCRAEDILINKIKYWPLANSYLSFARV